MPKPVPQLTDEEIARKWDDEPSDWPEDRPELSDEADWRAFARMGIPPEKLGLPEDRAAYAAWLKKYPTREAQDEALARVEAAYFEKLEKDKTKP